MTITNLHALPNLFLLSSVAEQEEAKGLREDGVGKWRQVKVDRMVEVQKVNTKAESYLWSSGKWREHFWGWRRCEKMYFEFDHNLFDVSGAGKRW